MFTGIVWGTAPISHISDQVGLRTIALTLPPELIAKTSIGNSVAVDGVCLTVSAKSETQLFFDVIQETLNITSLGSLTHGSQVNYEPSLKFGDQIGGHLLSGHVDGLATIKKIELPDNNFIVTLQIPEKFLKYVLRKGYVALNGASLTIVDLDQPNSTFSVHLIPETLRLTTFASKKEGALINFEIDRQTQMIVDSVRSILPGLLNRE